MYRHFFKRFLDIILSLLALIIFSPLYLILYFLIKRNLGTPVIFAQERPGLHGKVFKMYKFRSMSDQKDEHGNLLSDEIRLTPFGQKLRSTSLDELLELWNILKGDMSIVGPRPLLVEYLPLYSERQAHRHDVRPGLTGLAQVNGRNAITWEDKFNYDVQYVNNITFTQDIKIILLTIKKVLIKDGITADKNATIEKFRG